MAEMKIELDLLLITDPRKLYKEGKVRFLTFLDNQNHFLSESGRFLIFERRGIKTDLFAIERYVEEILEEVLSIYFSFKTLLVQKSDFMDLILKPISKNSKEILNQL